MMHLLAWGPEGNQRKALFHQAPVLLEDLPSSKVESYGPYLASLGGTQKRMTLALPCFAKCGGKI